jgi:hypothetical protein
MNFGTIVKNGAEYPCVKDDNNICSLACPNLITTEGFLIKEAIKLSRPTEDRVCAIKENYNNGH